MLQQERTLDEVRKKEIACAAKLNKLQKQVGKNKEIDYNCDVQSWVYLLALNGQSQSRDIVVL